MTQRARVFVGFLVLVLVVVVGMMSRTELGQGFIQKARNYKSADGGAGGYKSAPVAAHLSLKLNKTATSSKTVSYDGSAWEDLASFDLKTETSRAVTVRSITFKLAGEFIPMTNPVENDMCFQDVGTLVDSLKLQTVDSDGGYVQLARVEDLDDADFDDGQITFSGINRTIPGNSTQTWTLRVLPEYFTSSDNPTSRGYLAADIATNRDGVWQIVAFDDLGRSVSRITTVDEGASDSKVYYCGATDYFAFEGLNDHAIYSNSRREVDMIVEY